MKTAPNKKTCACGCGKEFVPKKGWQKFYDDHHRDAYHTALTHQARELVKSGKMKPPVAVLRQR